MNHHNKPSAEQPADWVDNLLGEPHSAPPDLAGRILDRLPPQSGWQRLFDWLLPSSSGDGLWRPVAVALVPLALGFALGLGSGAQDPDPLYDDVLALAFSDTYLATNEGYGNE